MLNSAIDEEKHLGNPNTKAVPAFNNKIQLLLIQDLDHRGECDWSFTSVLQASIQI